MPLPSPSKENIQAAAKELVAAQQCVKQAMRHLLAVHPLAQETAPYQALAAMQVKLNDTMQQVLKLRV